MKVLQLGKFYPIRGGVEKVMYHLMEGLSERGIQCDMLCSAEGWESYDIKLNDYAKVMCTRNLKKVAGTMITPQMISKLRSIVDNYDIVHVHHPDPMACLALFLSGFRGKVVLHWHSDIIKQHRLLTFYTPLQKWLLKRADLILCTSPVYLSCSQALQPYLNKASYLPIGIRPLSADPKLVAEIQEKYHGKKLIFSLGRLVPYKGFENLISAAKQLPEDYVIAIGGNGPLRDTHAQQIASLGLDDKVKLLGCISDEEVAAYFSACQLFCLPSVFKTEAFGIVLLEAMSVGKPIVATNIPGSGVSWVNAHDISGINVEVGNPQALAQAIASICSSPELYKKYSEGSLHRYQSHFTFDEMIDGIESFYKELRF